MVWLRPYACAETQIARTAAQQGWCELEPALLPLIQSWLEPHGAHGWHDPAGVLCNAEPICAALNLYKLLLIRASHTGCMPGDTL